MKCNLHLFCASAESHLCLKNSTQENNARRPVHLFDEGFLFRKMFPVKHKESETTKSLFTFQHCCVFKGLPCSQEAKTQEALSLEQSYSVYRESTPNLLDEWGDDFWILCRSGGIAKPEQTQPAESSLANSGAKQCTQYQKSRLHL